jgi:D-glycero-alpha-D-manno-heptose-7-phosphate kinase
MAERGRRPRLVTTQTPLRLSFVGGGSDLPDFYRKETGAVISTAIDKYIYVTVKHHSALFREMYRVNYSVTERSQSLDDIQNDIVRECLRLVPFDPPLYINTSADLPANSGLASSSAFAVGLLYALHQMRGEDVSAGQLAEEACVVEIDVLKRPIGKQDQYAAAFGGLNLIQFHPDGEVSLDHLWLGEHLSVIFDSSLVFWTGIQRDASMILTEQRGNMGSTHNILATMRDDALHLRDLFRNGFSLGKFGAMLDCNWQRKRQLASLISDERIDQWYESAMKAGGLGGKLLGAGGGGFLYFVAHPERHAAIRQALGSLAEVSIKYEPRGSRILYTVA